MDITDLRCVAEDLFIAETVCSGLKKISDELNSEILNSPKKSLFGNKKRAQLEEDASKAQKNFENALKDVVSLTAKVNSIRAKLPECSSKKFWWDIPFKAVETTESNTFHFEDGVYIEANNITDYAQPVSGSFNTHPTYIDCQLLNMRLCDNSLLPLYLSKKKIIAHINDSLEIRKLYNVISVTGNFEVVSQMNTSRSPAVAIWEDYKQYADERRSRLDSEMADFNERWDWYERIRHNSFYTNDERYFQRTINSGYYWGGYTRYKMSDSQYFEEKIWREYNAGEVEHKAFKDIQSARIRAEDAQAEAYKHMIKYRKDAVYSSNILRVMPVGEVIYCGDELLAILCYTTEQEVTEFDAATDIKITDIKGKYYSKRTLLTKKPSLVPLMNHITAIYSCVLPKHGNMKACPKNCPEELWRTWSQIRWLKSTDN